MQEEKIMMQEECTSFFIKVKSFIYRATKRTFDCMLSLVGILFLIPIALFVKILYLCFGDFQSIFYKQERIGLRGKIFTLYKFRTMKVGADEILQKLLEENPDLNEEYQKNKKLKCDPRITKAGNLVRKLSLDEFPQFINIFKGDMSLVGNRPYLPREKEDMGSFYEEIVKTKPGLTGYWQVNGRNNVTFHDRLVLEREYSRIQSFSLDIKIILKTFIQVFKRDGAM